MTQQGPDQFAPKNAFLRHLDHIAWAIFFIWVGLALLVDLPWGWFFLGVAVLILAVQFARRQMDAPVEGFWLACGVVLLVGALWQLVGISWPLLPTLLILLGVVLLGRVIIEIGR
jgi:hypothetical protein